MPKFKVQFNDGSSTEVQAFSRDAVFAMYPNAALVNNHAPRPIGMRETLPHATETPIKIRRSATPAQFTIDMVELSKAVALLGLKVPIVIRFNARRGSTNGNYLRNPSHHQIMLKSYRSAQAASETLWHELCHAMQAERAGSIWDWNVVSNSQRKNYTYRSRPIEIEARAMSEAHRNDLLCY